MVQTYLKIASTRFADSVPQVVDLVFLHKFTETLQDHLVEELGLVDPKVEVDLNALVVEDKEIVKKRDELIAKKECFLMSLDELGKLNC